MGRSIELVFSDGQEEQGGSGSGMRGGRGVHGAARFRIWPSQQVARELPEGGVGRKRTRGSRRREEGGGENRGVHHEQRLTGDVDQWG
jgi:hypothetical protein